MTQFEIDNKLNEINRQYYAEKRMLEVANEQICAEKRRVMDEIDALNQKVRNLKDQMGDNLRAIKDINIKYNEMRRQLRIEYPREQATNND